MGRVYSTSVTTIKTSLYCYSCPDTEMVIIPRQSPGTMGGSFGYICPRCRSTEHSNAQYPIIEYVQENKKDLEIMIQEGFAKLIAFSDLPKYLNSEDTVLREIVKNRLIEGK